MANSNRGNARQRTSLERRSWMVWLVGLITVGATVPVPAQVTYNVFPATSPQAPRATAQPTGPGASPVTLNVQDSTVAYVVHALVHQANLRLVYNGNDPLFAKRISVHVDKANVLEALAIALKGTGLAARMASDEETVLVRSLSGEGASAERRIGGIIMGHVTDSASGQGLGGAAVRVEGIKSLATVTSDSGHFTLRDVPTGEQVLTVKLFGYKPAERTVTVVDSERTTVRIAMVPVPTVLSGVVTTATGLQRKIAMGNDITTLNVDSIMQVAPIQTLTDLLETRVPGLTVLHSDGVPGDPSRIRIRGIGSITENNDPIIIVDGVRVYASQSDSRNNNLAPENPQSAITGYGSAAPSPLDQIDPSSIATIEVLKGPSASALYGSDAANGVIVITTKHGRAGPTHWSLQLGQGVNWLPGSWPSNYYRFGSGFNSGDGLCAWNAVDFDCSTTDSIVAFQALNDPAYTVFSHGSDQTANLTISGGVPTLTYNLTGSAAGDLGNLTLPRSEVQRYDSLYGPIPHYLVRPDNYTTYGGTGTLTAQPNPKVQVTLTSSLFNSAQQQGSLQGAISQLEGEYIGTTGDVDGPGIVEHNLANAPLIQNDVQRVTDNQLTSNDALTVNWRPKAWLPFNMTAGLNTIQRTDETYIPYGVNAYGPGGSFIGDTAGSYGLGRGTSRDQTLNAGTAIPLFRQRLTLALGGNVYNESTADFSAYTNQLAPGVSSPTTFPTTVTGSGGSPSSFSQSTSGASTYGWYVEPRFNVASKFFVSPGFRLDGGSGGSTSAGSVGGLSAFPKIDVSYLAVDRPTGHSLWGFLTQFRPRAAFGLAGTQPGPADKLRLFNVGDYTLGDNLAATLPNGACGATVVLNDTSTVPAVCLNALGNTQLRPERSTELEGGFDATLWQGRLTVTYTQYNKTRHDAIISIPVAPSVSGLEGTTFNIEKNIGEVRNTGTELTLNVVVLQSRALSWNVGANLSNDNNLVVHLNPGQAPICLGAGIPCQGTIIKAGYPLSGEWALPIVSYADANHDGVIENSEVRLGDSAVYVGQQDPKYQFNLNTDLTLFNGRFSLHATFAYQNGLTQFNDAAGAVAGFSLLPNAPNTPLATQAAVVEQECYVGDYTGGSFSSGCSNQGTDIGLIQTVHTFRFNDLSINYNVPTSISSRVRVPRMTIALQGSNLTLHSNYRGKDPDVNAFSTVSAGDETADLGEIPEPRTWWLKVSLGN